MNTQRKSTIIIKILLFILFVIALISSVFTVSVSQMLSQKAVEKRLEKNGFYTLLEEDFSTNIEELHSVIGIDTAALLQMIDMQEMQVALQEYTATVTAKLFDGTDKDFVPQVSLDKAETLIQKTFSPEQYGENTVLMEIDRQAALSDIKNVIVHTIEFFPLSLYDKVAEIVDGKVSFQTVYTTIRWIKRAVPLCVALTMISGGLLVFLTKDRKAGLRHISGTGFIVTAVLLFPVTLLRFGPLLQKLSLADGLLRRFVFAVLETIGNGYLFTALCWFLGFALFFVGSVIFSAISYKNEQNPTCDS